MKKIKNLYKGNLKVNRKQKNNLLLLEKLLNTKVKNSILWCFAWMDVFIKNKPVNVLENYEENNRILMFIRKTFKVLLKEFLIIDENLECLAMLPHARKAKQQIRYLINLIKET